MLAPSAWAAPASIFDFKVTTLEGQTIPLSTYQGKTLLIVNTASKCGYTPQYAGLERIYTKYKDKGFLVLGFPSNDFGGQEPGTNGDIKKFCQAKYNVDFPMFSKAPVKGADTQPLYLYLKQNAPADHQGEIKWNFEKFLINPAGQVVGRFDSKVTPDDRALEAAIEKNLPH